MNPRLVLAVRAYLVLLALWAVVGVLFGLAVLTGAMRVEDLPEMP